MGNFQAISPPCLSSSSMSSRATSACKERTPTDGASHTGGCHCKQPRLRLHEWLDLPRLHNRDHNRVVVQEKRLGARPSWYVPVSFMHIWTLALPFGR